MNVNLETGEAPSNFRAGQKREISLVGRGRLAYLWVGNTDESNGACFGHLSGVRLRKLAQAILETVPQPKPRKKAR